MRYLLDTNVLSQLRGRGRRHPEVAERLEALGEENLCTSVLVIGETRHGIELLAQRDPGSARTLERWLEREILAAFADRILPITQAIAERWGRLGVPDPVPIVDGLLAATAFEHDLVLVTRNLAQIQRIGVPCLNPFEPA